ncbi:MAG TPA: hypothetical protein PKM72_11360 [Nitrospirales bacterium]|nr:hypothetical protein [Nitrospirales bacterium]
MESLLKNGNRFFMWLNDGKGRPLIWEEQMAVMEQVVGRAAILILLLLVIGGCSNATTDTASEEPKANQSGFTASVSGSVDGEVSGAGVATYLPPKERDPVTGSRPGYFLVANLNSDGTEEREFLFIFRIPDKAEPGDYDLVTPNPLNVGENFDVQVEMVEKGESISYQTNTVGTITLENFAPEPTDSGNSNITGTFQFVTENSEGDQISATGTFDFPLGRKMVSQYSGYSVKEVFRG